MVATTKRLCVRRRHGERGDDPDWLWATFPPSGSRVNSPVILVRFHQVAHEAWSVLENLPLLVVRPTEIGPCTVVSDVVSDEHPAFLKGFVTERELGGHMFVGVKAIVDEHGYGPQFLK